MKELITFLGYVHPLSVAAARLLEEKLEPRAFSKGEFVLIEGQVQKSLYFITEGVQYSYLLHNGKKHILGFSYPPFLSASPESFHEQKPSKYFIECLTGGTMYVLSFEELQRLFEESREIERLFRKLSEAVLSGIINRHLELHSMSMEERFRTFVARSPHLFALVPHKYIANYLNISPTNFSKLYNKIKI